MKNIQLRRTFVAFGLVGIGALAAACELILPIHDNIPDVAEEAGADGTPPPPTPNATCPVGLHPPPKPTADDSQNGGTYLLAVSAIDILEPRTFGFDVDGVCTCDPRDGTNHDGGAACVAPTGTGMVDQCDPDGGVDNAFAYQVNRVGAASHLIAERLNAQILCGYSGIVIELDSYNGLANDTDVFIRFMPSYGIHQPHPDGGDPDAAGVPEGGGIELYVDAGDPEAGLRCGFWQGDPFPPLFNGSDLWSAPPGMATSGTVGKTATTTPVHGYVKDWVFALDPNPGDVVSVPLTGNTTLPVRTPIMSVHIVPLDANMSPLDPSSKTPAAFIRFDGAVVGGRIDRVELMQSFATLTYDPSGAPVCSTGGVWDNIRLGACHGTDLTGDPDADFKGLPCTALSLGLGFAATPAIIGFDYATDAGTPLSACDAQAFTCP